MKDSTAMAMFVAGLILTMLGAGGIEASMDNVGLAQGVLVSIVGLMTMGVGVLAIKVNSNSNFYN
jgi:ABC-type Mn2+/Zn2+ transport system permease subunit